MGEGGGMTSSDTTRAKKVAVERMCVRFNGKCTYRIRRTDSVRPYGRFVRNQQYSFGSEYEEKPPENTKATKRKSPVRWPWSREYLRTPSPRRKTLFSFFSVNSLMNMGYIDIFFYSLHLSGAVVVIPCSIWYVCHMNHELE